jgi:flagellar biosynthesis/type III secretory pathway M-ring protein FliF/YscJ
MQKLHEIVMMATGVDTSRGDQLTVQNVAFSYPVVEEPPAPGVVERFGPQIGIALKVIVILVLGLSAFFFVGRHLTGRRLRDAVPVDEAMLPRQLPRTIEEIEGEIAAQLDSSAVQLDRRLPVLTRKLTGLAQKDPEVAARLVRTWLLEDKK